MSVTNQSSDGFTDESALTEVEAIIERARSGDLAADAAVAAIGQIAERRKAASSPETYQKPWG